MEPPEKSKNTKKLAKQSSKIEIKVDRAASKSSINDMEDEIEDAKASILYDTNAEICKASSNNHKYATSYFLYFDLKEKAKYKNTSTL